MDAFGVFDDGTEVPWAERLTRQERLRAAILIDAIKCLRERASRPLHRRVRLWISQRDDRSPFAFTAVCEALHLSPERVRKSMLAIGDTEAPHCIEVLAKIERLTAVDDDRWHIATALRRMRSRLRRPAATRRRRPGERPVEVEGPELRP